MNVAVGRSVWASRRSSSLFVRLRTYNQRPSGESVRLDSVPPKAADATGRRTDAAGVVDLGTGTCAGVVASGAAAASDQTASNESRPTETTLRPSADATAAA